MTTRMIRTNFIRSAIGLLLALMVQQEAFGVSALARSHRQPVPPSLLDRIQPQPLQAARLQDTSNLECGVNAMCASFDPPVAANADVSGWMGFKYQPPGTPIEFFIATLGREAIPLQDNLYATPLWDKRHFWLKVDENTMPLAIQPRFIRTESGHEYYAADYFAYRIQGVDYSSYPYDLNASLSSLIIEFNPTTETVTDFWVDYYDENIEYVTDVNIELGDEVIPYFLGFERSEPDAFYLFQAEPLVTVTMAPQIYYAEAYPGSADFPCTYCGDLDTSKVQFHYMFESVTEKAEYEWQYTDPMQIITKALPIPVLPWYALLVLAGIVVGVAWRYGSRTRP